MLLVVSFLPLVNCDVLLFFFTLGDIAYGVCFFLIMLLVMSSFLLLVTCDVLLFSPSCVDVKWKMCTTYRASFPHILEKSDSVLFTLSWQQWMLLTCAFSKQNSVISLEEWALVLKLFTTATRMSRVKACPLPAIYCLTLYVFQCILWNLVLF